MTKEFNKGYKAALDDIIKLSERNLTPEYIFNMCKEKSELIKGKLYAE